MNLAKAFTLFMASGHRAHTTRLKYHYRLKPFLEAHGNKPLKQITPDLLANWFRQLAKTQAPASLAIHRACHVALFNFCVKNKWLKNNPAESLPKWSDKPLIVAVPTEENVRLALELCRDWRDMGNVTQRRDACIFFLAAMSGKRRGEVLNLRLSHVLHSLKCPLRGGVYAVETVGKSGRAALVYNEEGARFIKSYLELRPKCDHDRFFIVTESAHMLYCEPLGDNAMQHIRRRICKTAGVPLLTYQQLRRFKATQIGRKYGLQTACEALGHSSVSVTKAFYYNPDKEAAYSALIETAL